MKHLYLALAILGAVVPYAFFLPFFSQNGISLPTFMSGVFANGAASGFTADLLISSVVFWLFMFAEQRRGPAPSPYLFLVLNLCIGLSCALPAYLYERETRPNVPA